LYQRIRSDIVALILDGRAAEGDLLPSVRTLAADLGANPFTVARACQTLQSLFGRDLETSRVPCLACKFW
jgi:GntR family transcriptional regulator